MQKIGNNFYSLIGFLASAIGVSGLLFGKNLFYIFPIPFFCGISLIKDKKNKKDLINGMTCLIVSGILLFYIFVTLNK